MSAAIRRPEPLPALAWLFVAMAYVVSALAISGGCGCASTPDALRAAIATSDATGAALSAARLALRARIAEDVTECASTCPDDACIARCGRTVLEQTSAMTTRLDVAIALHGVAVDTLAAARACRASDAACEDEAQRVARAVSQLAQAAALLREESGR